VEPRLLVMGASMFRGTNLLESCQKVIQNALEDAAFVLEIQIECAPGDARTLDDVGNLRSMIPFLRKHVLGMAEHTLFAFFPL
jgi:hypothetical protein